MSSPEKTAIIVVGATASGKTSISLKAATALHTSIISADSRQCYREMNIGVAKPTADELSLVPHYFINSHSVHEHVNAVVFEQEALQAADSIFSNHEFAVLTGGTGLYVKVFCEGIDSIPAADPSVKGQVDQVFKERGIQGLQQWLTEVDPAYMQQSKETGNRVRLMRALEIKLSSGRSILDYRVGAEKKRPFQIRKYGITWPRDILYKRINDRVDDMMSKGLLQEAESLFPLRHLKALQTVGYQELFSHIEGQYSLQNAVEKIRQHTRNYAKRQMTWFKQDSSIEWFSYDQLLEKFSAI